MKVAVVQPLPGIGDMIWHLPHIRAIAAHIGEPVTLITKPRSAADQIFSAETTIADIFWLDRNPDDRKGKHDGGGGFLRVVKALRGRRFDAVYLLHHSKTIALLTMLAGIPARYGYGYGVQKRFLNRGPFLPDTTFHQHPFDQATAWLSAAGIPMTESEPILRVDNSAVTAARTRLDIHSPPIVLGIGSSEPYKQWGAIRFAELADRLSEQLSAPIVLVGGHAEAPLAAEIQALAKRPPRTVLGWNLMEIAALFSVSAFYAGNDTGVMNIAAAAGLRTYGLFGGVAPFGHSSRVVPIIPPGGVSKTDGMARLTVDQVVREIEADQAVARA